MAKKSPPVVFGTCGIGGYAGSIFELIHATSVEDPSVVKLAAVCEPDPGAHTDRVASVRSKGVKLLSNYDELLAEPGIEAVWLPLPINLHRPFTEKGLAAGKAVMCEKPAAGIVDDLDAMIVARDRTKRPVAIGFQDIYDPTTLLLKRRLLGGTLGKISTVTLFACWPRDSRYYGRSNWAGALKRNDVWVLDSPANNALAHFINLPLFLLGKTEETSASPLKVEAELYRANPIENYDTCSLRLTLEGGVTFLILLTHACREQSHPLIEITGENGTLMLHAFEKAELDVADTAEVFPFGKGRPSMVRTFSRLVRGLPNPSTAIATLEQARCHLIAVNGASEATPVRNIPESAIEQYATPNGGTMRAVPGIEEAFKRAVREGKMLHELKTLSWTQPAGVKDLTDYKHFAGLHPG